MYAEGELTVWVSSEYFNYVEVVMIYFGSLISVGVVFYIVNMVQMMAGPLVFDF